MGLNSTLDQEVHVQAATCLETGRAPGTALAGSGTLGRVEGQPRVRLVMGFKALVNSDLAFPKGNP